MQYIYLSVSQSVSQSASQSASQSISQLVNQSISQLVSQSHIISRGNESLRHYIFLFICLLCAWHHRDELSVSESFVTGVSSNLGVFCVHIHTKYLCSDRLIERKAECKHLFF